MLYHFVKGRKTGNITKLSTSLKNIFDNTHILMAQSLVAASIGGATGKEKELFDGNPSSS
ncbi:hypothetical protein [Hoeflea poritis]|uniref:Uncharacterized protein n=1 Tax=Hoeflea poritis TaxID=2993659 RepID=A0ABT4VQW4_9HYPH|nr:hypothetical protein [Hoeflea poritis]MDA4847101.1 hypothetical protein [Hoeflea poritis]